MAVHGHCMPALLLILFHIMPVAESSTLITGFVGDNVTLPCSYDAKHYGGIYVCWSRGEIPLTGGCGNEIIEAKEFKVTWRKSHRYQLIGDLNQGDVSLTIISAEMGDSGIYGCRVEIPGLFNDLKNQVNLTIKNIRKTTASPTDAASPETQTAISLTHGHKSSYSTGSSTAKTPQGSDHADRCLIIITVVIMLLLLLVSVMVMAIWSHKRKQQREARTLAAVEHQTDDSVYYVNMGSCTRLHIREKDRGTLATTNPAFNAY
ncbi:hepatitis A virus cellular receptor 2 homolog isoform X7 [Paramormyrops kingsleyae]|uniref:hepatitis A virus cellular receptor 2 homolog isoform X7 n=1 Tax=Paramormyrops kingsleyae TaxID=1676925 RepID=UPI003B970D40